MNGVKYCPKCGAQVTENARFCYHCMTQFGEKTQIEKPRLPMQKKHRIILVCLLAAAAVTALGVGIIIISLNNNGLYLNNENGGDYSHLSEKVTEPADNISGGDTSTAGKQPSGSTGGSTANVAGKTASQGSSSTASSASSSGSKTTSQTSSSASKTASQTSSGSNNTTSSQTSGGTSSQSNTGGSSSGSGGSTSSSGGSTATPVHTHTYSEATCQKLATCTSCGAVSGTTAAHKYSGGQCVWCGRINSDYYNVSYSNPFIYNSVWNNQAQTINYSVTSTSISVPYGTTSGNVLTISYIVNSATSMCREIPFEICYYDNSGNLIDSAHRSSINSFYHSAGSTGSFKNLTIPSGCKSIVISN